jgi:hypothetical protein
MNFFEKYFIPKEENDYKPRFFGEASLFGLFLIIIIVFGIAVSGRLLIMRGNFPAAVLNAVLADLANQDRGSESLHTLAINTTLQKAAQMKADDMASKGYFAHQSPDGHTPWYWFQQAGYEFSYAGENLAVNFGDSADVNTAWMNSPGHRANILNGNFTEIGIATAQGVFEGRSTIFVVELFGSPAAQQVAIEAPIVTPISTSTLPKEKTLASKITIRTTAPTSTASVLSTIASSSVLGESGKSELFIAVQKESAAVPLTSVNAEFSFASLVKELATSPKKLLSFIYLILASLITIALVFMIFIEIRRQHALHVFYAAALLLLITILFYLYQSVLFAPLLIV